MSERPILFSAPMVRAILDGMKTVTRRVVTAKHASDCDLWAFDEARGEWEGGVYGQGGTKAHGMFARCPYGVPGDRLWVRETFGFTLAKTPDGEPTGAQEVRDPGGARRNVLFYADDPDLEWCDGDGFASRSQWRPSIHMPRWASRITLDVVSVRVERVQDITEADARAEGITEPAPAHGAWCDPAKGREGHWSYRKPFAALWDSINAARGFGWDANPWVWVVEFKPIEAAPRREGG